MKYSLSLAALALLFTSSAQARFQPTQYDSWNIVLGDRVIASSLKEKIIEVDLANSSASHIEEFHNHGKKVICYFSGGTVEMNRSYYSDYKKVDGLVRNVYGAWDQERWIDYRVPEYKSLIKQRIAEAVKKNCDAIDVDNVDGYQISDVKKWSKPLTKDDAIKFTSWLGETAHSMGISIGLKNCLDIVDSVGKYYDFAINERCHKRDECHYYKNFLKTGKPAFGIAYGGMSDNRKALCKNLNGLPMSFVVKPTSHLTQEQVTFDIKEHCGSDYHSGKVDPPKQEEPKKTTEAKTTTTASPAATPAATTKQVADTKQTTDTKQIAGDQAQDKQGPANQADKQDKAKSAEKDAPVVSSIDGNDETKDNGGSNVAGVAISGSVIGAAAVFVFLKKNPKKADSIKRGISRRATSIKRGATQLSRRVTTRNSDRI